MSDNTKAKQKMALDFIQSGIINGFDAEELAVISAELLLQAVDAMSKTNARFEVDGLGAVDVSISE